MQLRATRLTAIAQAVRDFVKAFNPRSLFANGEQGVWYDPSDVKVNWRRNLLTKTEQFDDAVWVKLSAYVSANSIVAPDGTLTGDTITRTVTGTNESGTRVLTSQIASTVYTLSVYAKAGTAGNVLYMRNLAVDSTTSTGLVKFNLSSGTVDLTFGSLYTGKAFIDAVGNGWYRCSISATTLATIVNNGVDIGVTSLGTIGGTSGDYAYIWGAQLEVGSTASEYQRIDTPESTYLQDVQRQPVLFQDAAGTTPVTALEQPVGLMLDKSKGLVASTKGGSLPGLVGSFFNTPNATANQITGDIDIRVSVRLIDWTPPTAQTVLAKRLGAATNYSYSLRVNTNGALYFEYGTSGTTVTGATSTSVTSFTDGSSAWVRATRSSSSGDVEFFTSLDGTSWTKLGNTVSTPAGSIFNGTAALAVGAYSTIGEGQTNGKIYRAQVYSGINGTLAVDFNPTLYTSGSTFTAVTGEVWTIKGNANITPDGNHATQPTSTSRPIVSARVNLLTKTEQFDDAVWGKIRSSVTANTATSPNGTLTADLLKADTNTNSHYTGQANSVTIGTVYTMSASFKKAQLSQAALRFYPDNSAFTTGTAIFNLDTGVVISTTAVTATIQPEGNGWYRCTATATATASAVGTFGFHVADGSSVTFTGDGTSGIYIWGADLRVANDGVNLPPYQRVNTATDYDSTGFPVYLRADGVDDGMVTNSIDFTATDKMTVVAGVRKLSDAARGVFVELGNRSVDPSKSFTINTPDTAALLSFNSRGSTAADASASTNDVIFAAPTTNVLTGIGNISGDQAILRVNGTQAAINTADQGTGNYGNYPLYLFRRGGTTLPFNGRFYSLIVRFGPNLSVAQIEATEAYVNRQTGAFDYREITDTASFRWNSATASPDAE